MRRRLTTTLVTGVAVVLGAAPAAALATTGTNTDKRTVVTISKKGVTYKPVLTKMKLSTGVTLRLHVVNKTHGKHVFVFGKHHTKVIKPGKAATVYYVLDTPGKYPWKVERGHVGAKKFSGVYVLPLPNHFH